MRTAESYSAQYIRALALFLFSVVVMAWRRPDQIAAPALWFEEGTDLLKNYADCGLCALWLPSVGNNALSAKLMMLPIFKLSILLAPAAAAVVATLFNAAVVCAIAFAPTHLRAKYLCALCALLIPTGTENYAILLYSVWWSGILVALALLWDTSKGLHWLRMTFLTFGGLSTPLMIVAGPLFFIRAYKDQNAKEMTVVVTAGLLFLIAALVAFSAPPTQPFDINLTADALQEAVSKFFGMFIAPSPANRLVGGILLIAAIAALAVHERSKLDFYFFLLVALLFASIAATLVRTPVAGIHPFEAGPRYFFLPYLCLCFILLWLWSLIDPMKPLLKSAPIAVIAAAIIGGLAHPFFIHPVQERKSWSDTLSKCANTEGSTNLPLGYNWEIAMPQEQCRSLLSTSLLRTGN